MKKVVAVMGMMVIAVGLIMSGCATTGSSAGAAGSAADEAQVDAVVAKFAAAVLKADINGIMALVADDFAHDGWDYDAKTKADLKVFLEEAEAQGNMDGVELGMDDIEVTIEDGEATVYPIDYSISEGTVTLELVMAKKAGAWKIVDMTVEGLY